MNTKHFLLAYINDSNGWIPRMNDSSAPGFDNGRNDSSRYPVCEICATDDCRWPFFFKNLLCAREGEKEKKKREKYGWAEDETSESETWRYICLPLTNPAPDKKGWKIIPHLNVDLFLNFSLPIFLNVWKEKDKCYPAGVFHISIDVLVLYHKSGVEMKEEFFIGRGWWQHLSPRYLFGYTYFSIFNDIYRLIFLLF